MEKTINNITFKELKNEMITLDVQIQELMEKKHMLTKEMETRKVNAIATYYENKKIAMEAVRMVESSVRVLGEMGIDPSQLPSYPTGGQSKNPEVSTNSVVSAEANVSENSVDSEVSGISEIAEVKDENKSVEPIPESAEAESQVEVKTIDKEMETIVVEDNDKEIETPKKSVKSRDTKSPDKTSTPDEKKKRKASRLLIPYYKLLSEEGVNHSLNVGNLKHRDNYPNPDETRVFSSYGIAPTITATHSKLWIKIGTHPDSTLEESPISLAG